MVDLNFPQKVQLLLIFIQGYIHILGTIKKDWSDGKFSTCLNEPVLETELGEGFEGGFVAFGVHADDVKGFLLLLVDLSLLHWGVSHEVIAVVRHLRSTCTLLVPVSLPPQPLQLHMFARCYLGWAYSLPKSIIFYIWGCSENDLFTC